MKREPRLVRHARQCLEGHGLRGRALLVACSAGVDSTVLLDVLCALREPLGLRLAVGHVNHGLRAAESDADEAFVRELARARGLEARVERVAPRTLREGRSSRARPTLQEAARRLRYDALFGMADDLVATAHTLDDQAETVLLRLLRGAGPDGLGGIPDVSERVVRPLLAASRAEVEAHARALGLAWREDASNASPSYTRNRVRVVLRQLAADFNPRLLRALGDLAEAQRRDRAWIETLVEREAAARFLPREGGLVIESHGWAELPDPLALRLARLALRRCGLGRHASRAHLERMVRHLREGRDRTSIEVPGGFELVRESGHFELRAKLARPAGSEESR